jgi:Ca2+-binding EF-hand superfamily protein
LNRFKTLFKTKKLKTPLEADRDMREAFKALDKDNNGRIAEVELRQILGTLGDALTQQEVQMTRNLS